MSLRLRLALITLAVVAGALVIANIAIAQAKRSSGRLAVLDASECPPTFGVPASLVQAVIAGGQRALVSAVEGAEDDAELSLSEAAAESGYSSDHLRRLHRLGKLPAYRKGRNLFFRSGDLPRKPTAPRLTPYDPVTDARRVTTAPRRAMTEDP